MNTFKGPFQLIFEEMRPTFYINTVITIVLMAFFIVLGFLISSDGNVTSGVGFGPYYAIFFIYPFVFFQGYKYILSLGGTRKQFMMAAFASTIIYIVLGMLILNGLYFLSKFLTSQHDSSVTFFHMADLVNGSNSLLYIWIDILWCIFLFGIGMIIKSIWFNLGTLRTLMAATVLLIALITTVTFADLSTFIEFVIVNHFLFVHILAVISVLFMLLSYLVMRNGPLERGGR